MKNQKFSQPHKKLKSGERYDQRWANGGARTGAGRPFGKDRLTAMAFALEEVKVKQFSHGQIRTVKKPRIQILLESLFQQAMKGDLKAANLWLDIAMGKPEKVYYKMK